MKGARNVRRRLLAAGLVGTLAVAAATVAQPSGVQAAVPCVGLCAGGEYHALDAPFRVFRAPVRHGVVTSVDLLQLSPSSTKPWLPTGQAIVPSDVLSVLATITVESAGMDGYLRAYSGTTVPNASNVNFRKGRTVSNLAVLRTDGNGKINVSMFGSGVSSTVDIDVIGWWSTSSYDALPDVDGDERGARIEGATPPVRLLDTRNGTAADKPVPAGGTLELRIRDAVKAGTTTKVPVLALPGSSTVSSVFLNVTAVQPAGGTALSVQAEAGVTGTRSSSVAAGAVTANAVAVKVGADGKVRIRNIGKNAVNVVVDLQSVMREGADVATTTGRVVPLALPYRVFDTRSAAFGAVPLGPRQAEDWSFAAFSNSVNIGGVAVGAQSALIGNLTNASLKRAYPTVPVTSYLTVYPPAATPPVVSNVNTTEAGPVANMALVTYGADQVARVFNYAGYAHYLLDVYAVVLK